MDNIWQMNERSPYLTRLSARISPNEVFESIEGLVEIFLTGRKRETDHMVAPEGSSRHEEETFLTEELLAEFRAPRHLTGTVELGYVDEKVECTTWIWITDSRHSGQALPHEVLSLLERNTHSIPVRGPMLDGSKCRPLGYRVWTAGGVSLER